MRRILVLLLLGIVYSNTAVSRPVEYTLRAKDSYSFDVAGKSHGVFRTAVGETTYFGGTYWNAARGRWEAIADSVWTFDTGIGSDFNPGPEVNPFKDPQFHTHMEGWVGRDDTYPGTVPYMRLLENGDPLWSASGADICVGTNVGLQGNASWWAGITENEVLASTTACYYGGQGYGNRWQLFIERTFPSVAVTTGSTLSFDVYVETEENFDFAKAYVDTGDGFFQEVWTASGVQGVLSPSVALEPGVFWPLTSQDVIVRLGVESDGAWSDEDGLNPTACGAVAYDNVRLTGDVTYGPQNFETGPDGWTAPLPNPGIGDFSDIRDRNTQMPEFNTACQCDLQDTVLTFFDPAGAVTGQWHPLDQENMAQSPWIDIEAEGLVGSPVVFMEFSEAQFNIASSFILRFVQAKYYPEFCPGTGQDIESGWASDGFAWYSDPHCDTVGEIPTRLDYSDVVDAGAQRIRMAVGVLNLCSGWQWCTGTSDFTPVLDNIRVGVAGNPLAPYVTTGTRDTPYDSFPENGSLRPDAPGRVDCNRVNDENQPLSSAGDTLIVLGGGSGWGSYAGSKIEVLFSVRPGPAILADAGLSAGFNAWLTGHTYEGNIHGMDWYSARMDTAELNGSGGPPSRWMTAYHEDDPNFSGLDTDKDFGDLNPYGLQTRLANDIFPDDMFTPGTHLAIVYRASWIDSSGNNVHPGEYYYHPYAWDLNGNFLEMEVLPSSLDLSDSTWNCTLYVNHADDRGAGFHGSTARVEDALDAVIVSGKTTNFEQTFYDIFDVEAPSSNQGSFGRPVGSEYGATAAQLSGYKNVIWYSRSLSVTAIKEPDADVLSAWLVSPGEEVGPNRIYLTGDGLASAMHTNPASSVTTLLNSLLGVDFICASYREMGCNASGAPQDANCIGLDPVGVSGAAHFEATTVPAAVIGNGCPEERDYDVVTVFGGSIGSGRPNESYNDGSQVTDYTSVSHDVFAGNTYRSVFDGLRIDQRRDAACAGDGAPEILDRMAQVGAWLGFAGEGTFCSNPYSGVDAPPGPPVYTTALHTARPNPFTGRGAVTVKFSLAAPGHASLEVVDINGRLVKVVFDGPAEAGATVVSWNGADQQGHPVASGVYFYRLVTQGKELSRKQVVVR